MNFGFIFKAIVFLVVAGGIFLTGVITGGSVATGMSEEGMLNQIDQCMPAESADDLRPCLVGDGQVQP